MNKYLFIEVKAHRGYYDTKTIVTEYNLDILDPLDAFKHIFLDRVHNNEDFFNDEVEPYIHLNTSTEREDGPTFKTVTYECDDDGLGMIVLVSSDM